ncbi:hypothetical protein SPURM210S_00245 [Streptomyces purpurascens]
MSDSTSEGRPEPDFLDRLLARHATPAARRPGVVRVRPRLAGPFERVEAVRAAAPDQDGTEPLWPVAAPAAVARPDGDTPGRPRGRPYGTGTDGPTDARPGTRRARTSSGPAGRVRRAAAASRHTHGSRAAAGPRHRPPRGGPGPYRAGGPHERGVLCRPPLVRTPLPPPPCPPRCSPARRTRRPHGTPSGRRRPAVPGARPSRWCRCRSGGWRSPRAGRRRAVATGPGHGTRSAPGPRSAWPNIWPGGASE